MGVPPEILIVAESNVQACSYLVCIIAVFSLSQCIAIKSSCWSEEASFVGLKCLQALCAESKSQWSCVPLLGCTSSWPCGERVGSFPWPLPPLLSHSVALVCGSPWSIESIRLASAILG